MANHTPINAYLVGGAVRDKLLGLVAHDRDWVVVGASPQQMMDAGYIAVGQDFPVFLHPESKEEYALARTERKTAAGYHGFAFYSAPDVRLEEDLLRRDLSINAIAESADGTIIDPYGGRSDLAHKILRHVSPAFAEDPVRILRVARFAARFADFSIAPETMALMQSMVNSGEVDALVAERVWQELARGLMQKRPSRMFTVLRECGALRKILPEVDALFGVPQPALHHPEIDTGIHTMMVLDMAAQLQAPLTVRFACLCHDLGKGTTATELLPRHIGHEGRSEKLLEAITARLIVPKECKAVAQIVAREHGNIHASLGLNAQAILRLLQRCDALRRPERFGEIMLACECDARGRLHQEEVLYPPKNRLLTALHAALSVDSAALAAQAQNLGKQHSAIGAYIDQARVMAISNSLKPSP